jgi:hypothetical protein
MSLPPLATSADVTARLGRSLNTIEAARINALLADGSAFIRRYCRKDFLNHPGDILLLRSSGGIVKLPYRPVQAVNSVTALSGAIGVPDISVTWYVFDEIDEITIPDPSSSGIINLPEFWYDIGWYSETFKVNYDHGFSVIPDEVISVLCTAAIALLTAPTQAGGVVGETIGSYSYRLQRTGGGISAALKDADLTALDDYRGGKYGTIQLTRP